MGNRRDVVHFDRATEGLPDGHAIDSNGDLWVAMALAGNIVQINPNTGEKLKTIKVADGIKMVTSCRFGGKNLDELYVTTGKNRHQQETTGDDNMGGSLFKITGLGVKGLQGNMFGQTQ